MNSSKGEIDVSPLPGFKINVPEGHGSGFFRTSFLVYRHKKYVVIPVERIAFFYLREETTLIFTFDRQEHPVNYPLEQIQHIVSDRLFFRLNAHYLIHFPAVKAVERYFAQKLLITPSVAFPEKLLVSKERAKAFLEWLEKR